MNTWRSDIIKALELNGGISPLSEIYKRVKELRQVVPESYQAMIRGNIESASKDSKVWDKKNDLFYSVSGIGGGVWGLRSMQMQTPTAIDVDDPCLEGGTVAPGKKLTQAYRIIRDTKLCREIKKLHNYECQICGSTMELPSGGRYAEAHHIVPLGGKHRGADAAENIIVVCPNHHAMLDYGVVTLDYQTVRMKGKHNVSQASVAYHNQNIFGKSSVELLPDQD